MGSIGSSDHEVVYLIPKYKRLLNKGKTEIASIEHMTEEGYEYLNAMFSLTNWDLFVEDANQNVDFLADLVVSYMQFCYKLCTRKKQIKICPNQKPWWNSEVKQACIRMKHAYNTHMYDQEKRIYKKTIIKAKADFKRHLEEAALNNKTSCTWKHLKNMMNQKQRSISILQLKN